METEGKLEIAGETTFTAKVHGFAAGDIIDLGVSFGPNTTLNYSENKNHSGGTLTVTDGSTTKTVAFVGHYTAASFAMATDGVGGTLITDPPSATGHHIASAAVDFSPGTSSPAQDSKSPAVDSSLLVQGTSAPITISVTDPPASTATSVDAPLTSPGRNRSVTESTADDHLAPNFGQAAAVLTQFLAAEFVAGAPPIAVQAQTAVTEALPFLSQPHH